MKCGYCKKEFTRKARYKKHVEEKICKRSYCELCKKQYHDGSALEIHKKSKMHIKAEEAQSPKAMPEMESAGTVSDEIAELKRQNEELKRQNEKTLSMINLLLSKFGITPENECKIINNGTINNTTVNNNITNINITLSDDFKEKEATRLTSYSGTRLNKSYLLISSTRGICKNNQSGPIEKDADGETITIKNIPYPPELIYPAITLTLAELFNEANKKLNQHTEKDDEKLKIVGSIRYSFLSEEEKENYHDDKSWIPPKYQVDSDELNDYINRGIPVKKSSN